MKKALSRHHINVMDIVESIEFYTQALGFHLEDYYDVEEGLFSCAVLENDEHIVLELASLKLGNQWDPTYTKEAFMTLEQAQYHKYYRLHNTMGCIIKENMMMGLYAISDPDGHVVELMPAVVQKEKSVSYK